MGNQWKGRRSKIVRKCLIFPAIAAFIPVFMFALMSSPAAGAATSTSTYHINASGGGDCSLIGSWNAAARTCTLSTDVTVTGADGIQVDSDNVALDGSGHTLTGDNSSITSGVSLNSRTGVTVRNLAVTKFYTGIRLFNSNNGNILSGNSASTCYYGFDLIASSNNTLSNNKATSNNNGIWLAYSSNNILSGNLARSNTLGVRIGLNSRNNTVSRNNFLSNTVQITVCSSCSANVFSLAAPAGGNYWSDWATPDANHDGFVDSPYVFAGGQDNLPLAAPVGGGRPDLYLNDPGPFWASIDDYNARQLSVAWSVGNAGSNDAFQVQLTGSTNTNGVTLVTAMPQLLGSGTIAGGGSSSVTLKYSVPQGVSAWHSSLAASAEDSVGVLYVYP